MYCDIYPSLGGNIERVKSQYSIFKKNDILYITTTTKTVHNFKDIWHFKVTSLSVTLDHIQTYKILTTLQVYLQKQSIVLAMAHKLSIGIRYKINPKSTIKC